MDRLGLAAPLSGEEEWCPLPRAPTREMYPSPNVSTSSRNAISSSCMCRRCCRFLPFFLRRVFPDEPRWDGGGGVGRESGDGLDRFCCFLCRCFLWDEVEVEVEVRDLVRRLLTSADVPSSAARAPGVRGRVSVTMSDESEEEASLTSVNGASETDARRNHPEDRPNCACPSLGIVVWGWWGGVGCGVVGWWGGEREEWIEVRGEE